MWLFIVDLKYWLIGRELKVGKFNGLFLMSYYDIYFFV